MSAMKLINRMSATPLTFSITTSRLLTGGAARCFPNYNQFKSTENARTMSSGTGKSLTLDNMNPSIIKVQYMVRGPLVTRAGEIEKEIQKGAKKPFKRVTRANLGDAHAMGSPPITFIRQVLACCSYPELINTYDFPADVKERATELLNALGGKSVGSYTMSHGVETIRRSVASYIEKRDGHPSNWEDIFISAGASNAIKNILQLFSNAPDGKESGIMIPIPQYPLYTAALSEYELEPVPYYLDEAQGWGLTLKELQRSIKEAQQKGTNVRAIVIINPGNPTGQLLTRENVQMIIEFAAKNNLFIFADEVYQHNVYNKGDKFYSFKKVLCDMGPSVSKKVEMASFMTISKGYMGECGLRGGWAELVNMDPAVQAQLYKNISAMLCPTSLGQIAVDCVARPPEPGSPSYDLWNKEKTTILTSLAAKAKKVAETLNQMPGFKCNVVQGAMYAFPSLELPAKALEEAKKRGQPGDVFYCSQLLEETGICLVPGSGFGQYPGTFHFRTTILPQPEQLDEMLETFQKFHKKFLEQYN